MSSPGNACPCGTNGGAQMVQSHRQSTSCGQPQQPMIVPQGVAGCQLPPPYQQPRPQVECTCTQNRARNVRPQPMSIQADVVTCSRPLREPCPREAPPAPMCNCRDNPPPPKPVPCQVVKPCTCTPIMPAPPPQVHTTHVHMPCPQQTHSRGPVPYQRQVAACGHCRSQAGKKKKCVIQ